MSQSGGEGTKGLGTDGDDNGSGDKIRKGKGDVDKSQPLISSSDEDSDQAPRSRSTFDCLAALEVTLPMKRGLSSHYAGKAKSFGNLTDLTLADPKDLAKKEHPMNKKRRLIIAQEVFHGENKQHGASSANAAQVNEDEEQHKDRNEEDK